MIRYILVDDSPTLLKRVKSKIDTIAKDYHLQHVQSYDSSKKAFETINETDYDLLIVDFEMPVYNGIELAQKIATSKKIIFLTSTTNNEKLVINSLDISGYLSKPFDIDEFQDILKHKIIGKTTPAKLTKARHYITLQIGANKDVRFQPEQVYYSSTSRNINGEQPDKNYVHIYGKNDEVLFTNVRLTISELYKALAGNNFEKISQSTIINMAHIKERDTIYIGLYDCKETFEITAKERLSFVAKLRAKFNI